MSELKSYTLKNTSGMSVEIINFGARIKSILFPVDNALTEMLVEYPEHANYLNDPFYLGATCGRVSNRISHGSFELDGEQIHVNKNHGEHCLHGGQENFALQYWQVITELTKSNEITLQHSSKDGDAGFPGQVDIMVRYHLSEDNKLSIHYHANTSKPTPINVTNHSYFSLGEDTCLNLGLVIDADTYLEVDNEGIPTGLALPTAASDFSFNEETLIGQNQQQANHPQLKAPLGYDHCYVLKNKTLTTPSAMLTSHLNNIRMSLYTDHEALQLYTGSFLATPFKHHQGVCLEAQGYIDAVNNNHFPSTLVRPEETYKQTIIFHFEHIER